MPRLGVLSKFAFWKQFSVDGSKEGTAGRSELAIAFSFSCRSTFSDKREYSCGLSELLPKRTVVKILVQGMFPYMIAFFFRGGGVFHR